MKYPSRNILIKIETNQNQIAGIKFLEQLDTCVYVSLSYTKAKISCKNGTNQKLKPLRTLNAIVCVQMTRFKMTWLIVHKNTILE